MRGLVDWGTMGYANCKDVSPCLAFTGSVRGALHLHLAPSFLALP